MCPVQYFQAVQVGKRRAGESQMRLFRAAGFAMLTLTTKKVDGRFMPVGEEELAAIIRSRDGFVTLIVDGDGFTKAQTKPLEEGEALDVYRKLLESGMDGYPGEGVEIWTESYPAVHRTIG